MSGELPAPGLDGFQAEIAEVALGAIGQHGSEFLRLQVHRSVHVVDIDLARDYIDVAAALHRHEAVTCCGWPSTGTPACACSTSPCACSCSTACPTHRSPTTA